MAKSKLETSWEEMLRTACEQWAGSILSLAKEAEVDYAQLHRFIDRKQSIGIDPAEKIGRALGFKLVAPKQPRKKT